MKNTIWIFAIILASVDAPASAQNITGFFHQQADKKKLMTAQIAALAVYRSQQGKGYAIAENGLDNAHRQKNQELKDHTAYFQSLSAVKPAVGAAQKKQHVADLQLQILVRFGKEISWQKSHSVLRADELKYLRQVADGIREKCEGDAAEMQAVTTPGKLQLTDAERIERMDKIKQSMDDKYAFTMSFTDRCRKLATARIRQKIEQEQLRKLYGH